MYRDRVVLTSRDILDKEFKIDTRGYRPQEVDKFLDVIIRDYEEMSSVIKELESEKKALVDDNIRLKQELRNITTKIDEIKNGTYVNGSICGDISSFNNLVCEFIESGKLSQPKGKVRELIHIQSKLNSKILKLQMQFIWEL